jgi:hypothetical protein
MVKANTVGIYNGGNFSLGYGSSINGYLGTLVVGQTLNSRTGIISEHALNSSTATQATAGVFINYSRNSPSFIAINALSPLTFDPTTSTGIGYGTTGIVSSFSGTFVAAAAKSAFQAAFGYVGCLGTAYNGQALPLTEGYVGFVGSGGLGSTRYANALGQTMGDVNTTLLQEQNKAKMTGYQSALDAAIREMTGQTQAAGTLGTLGAQEQQAATTGLKTGADIGAIEQAQNQALINAPTTMASNVAQILRGYTYPTVTTEKYDGPASSYGPSILSQIGGLGSVLASGTNSKDTGWLDKALNFVGNQFSSGPEQLSGPRD